VQLAKPDGLLIDLTNRAGGSAQATGERVEPVRLFSLLWRITSKTVFVDWSQPLTSCRPLDATSTH
jgi:hypothetical protein